PPGPRVPRRGGAPAPRPRHGGAALSAHRAEPPRGAPRGGPARAGGGLGVPHRCRARARRSGHGRHPPRRADAVWAAAPAPPEARLPVDVVAEGQLAGVVARLRGGLGTDGVTVPRNFRGTLRPYQERGLAWLARMADLCLGACLADDMGLGKTIQLLAFLLHR